MPAKKKKTNTDVRRNVKRALALSEQLTAALVDAAVEVEDTRSRDLAKAIAALRMIASSPSHEPDARWAIGIARGALRRIGEEVTT